MKARVRRPAILFALLSATYWLMVQSFWHFAMESPTVYHRPPAASVIWLFNGLPAIIYAVICLVFCHWLARRVVRQITQLPRDS